jgi:hypothetical protein
VTVTSSHVAALRAALGDDAAALSAWNAGPDWLWRGVPGPDGGGVHRRGPIPFAGERSPADVIMFVSQGHTRTSDTYGDLNPNLTEQLTLRVLRSTPVDGKYDEVARHTRSSCF